ncbi:MAG: hypothetical protein ABI488_21730 [Polyangiaceae bacterium]
MKRAIDKWTTSASIALVFSALLACKKKTDAPAPAASGAPASLVASALASATAAAAASAVPVVVAPPAVDAGVTVPAPVLGDVKRFPTKEKVATGAVKVTIDESKVYDEPDNTKPSVASLSKGLFVVRQATLGADWILVEFPSGVGKLSPGWIEAKSLGEQVQPAVTKAAVAAQTAATVASAKPATTAALVPTTTAAAAVTTAPPTPTAVPSVKKKPSLLSPPHH